MAAAAVGTGYRTSAASGRIRRNIGVLAIFDVVYVSPFMRTRETAAYIAGDEEVLLTPEDRIIERDWGQFGKLSRTDQAKHFPHTYHEKDANPLYARLDGGESMMDVYGRVRDMQGTLHREYPDGRVMMVTHGDLMNGWRYAIERMLPEEWEALDSNKKYDFKNCSLLHYSRVNPDDLNDVREHIKWRRFIHTTDPQNSPDDGQWVELPDRVRYSPQQLLQQVDKSPRLLR
ncbi:MAG: histidine phosphatase family protein [Candidatus Saccharimonas sp.]|nr:histidine phosphatase family protein [Candidatus Saccharimonas sp.]